MHSPTPMRLLPLSLLLVLVVLIAGCIGTEVGPGGADEAAESNSFHFDDWPEEAPLAVVSFHSEEPRIFTLKGHARAGWNGSEGPEADPVDRRQPRTNLIEANSFVLYGVNGSNYFVLRARVFFCLGGSDPGLAVLNAQTPAGEVKEQVVVGSFGRSGDCITAHGEQGFEIRGDQNWTFHLAMFVSNHTGQLGGRDLNMTVEADGDFSAQVRYSRAADHLLRDGPKFESTTFAETSLRNDAGRAFVASGGSHQFRTTADTILWYDPLLAGSAGTASYSYTPPSHEPVRSSGTFVRSQSEYNCTSGCTPETGQYQSTLGVGPPGDWRLSLDHAACGALDASPVRDLPCQGGILAFSLADLLPKEIFEERTRLS